MPLYIKDQEVSNLATDAVKVLGLDSKTEAVRFALKSAIRAARGKVALTQRLAAARDMAETVGPVDVGYDHKRDMDDLWDR